MSADLAAGENSQIYFVYPGSLQTRTGGYRYDKFIIEGLNKLNWQVRGVSLTGTYPFPSPVHREQALDRFKQLPQGARVIVDGLAFGVLPEQLAEVCDQLQLLALVHHPLALETGLSDEQIAELKQLEQRSLELAVSVITTSQSTADTLADYGVSMDRIRVIEPGVQQITTSLETEKSTDNCRLLCVATLTKRKGHDVLLRALASLTEHNWQLTCAGSQHHDPDTYQHLLELREQLQLQSRVAFVGEADEQQLAALYAGADAFVLASHYEGYGMVLAEAIGAGLPVIATAGGAVEQTVPAGTGLISPPGDSVALAQSLYDFFTDEFLRNRLTEAALAARTQLRSWEMACQEFISLLANLPTNPVSQSTSFNHSWLAMREKADHTARSHELSGLLNQWIDDHLGATPASAAMPARRLHCLDLGCGTGSNFRYLSPLLGMPQQWTLIDNDQVLLDRIPAELDRWADKKLLEKRQDDNGSIHLQSATYDALLERRTVDIASLLHTLPFADADLVTASALLDLTSSSWMDQLLAHLHQSRCAALFTLTYNGQMHWKEPHERDEFIRYLINEHQHRDKGFGPALGPDAVAYLHDSLKRTGGAVHTRKSDWLIGTEHRELQQALLDGWASAAAQADPGARLKIDHWYHDRTLACAKGSAALTVGHTDLLMLPVTELPV